MIEDDFRRDGKMKKSARRRWLRLTDEVERKYRSAVWVLERVWPAERRPVWLLLGEDGEMAADPSRCPYCIEVEGVCDKCIVPFVMGSAENTGACFSIIDRMFNNKTRRPIYNALRRIRRALEEEEI